ncbi:MAG: aminodeoxychorismate synthase component I [Candidatus Omnitrophica bacterium]|nr:aminodeoxychorismate synthase component I [Candidatus Omnitrophota bacterium]
MAYCILKSYKLGVDFFRVFETLKTRKNCFFLDSSKNSYCLGRFSFIGIDPFYILKSDNALPFDKLRELLNKYKIPSNKANPPFLGGAAGFLGYDLGFILEKKIKKIIPEDINIPNFYFAFYNTVIVADNLKKKLFISCLGAPEENEISAKKLACENFKKTEIFLSRIISKDNLTDDIQTTGKVDFNSNFTKKAYLAAVKKAKEYIKKGDVYQLNLSQRFDAETDSSAFEIYKRLRKISPSSFSAFFDAGDFQILSSSPERFISFSDGKVSTRPMKGTRPRGENYKEDNLLKKELLESQKDKAELTMIVDLERNDLGRVCSYDSIKVTKPRELEKYSTVYQTTSTIEGRLFKSKDRIDLLRACFPGGSITGCPKIRAMEIIEELEPNRRSIYTGSLGYLSFSGEMDFNILIRTILKKENKIYFGVGGGIVADSDPKSEYEETLCKAKAMMKALSLKG